MARSEECCDIEAADYLQNDKEDSGDEIFEDAEEQFRCIESMDLKTALDQTVMAMKLFLNNHFQEALEMLKPWADKSLYQSLGYAMILYMQASLTFQEDDIQIAAAAAKVAHKVCLRHRKKQTLLRSMLGGGGMEKLNEEELHAELCIAECLMIRALLTFISDENLISFVKGSLKIRACFNKYKECLKFLNNDKEFKWSMELSENHFRSGVMMGCGMFNLMLSLLPTRILKLLEFIGFSGDKDYGLTMLKQGNDMTEAIRSPICSLALLTYHSIITYVLGAGNGDIALCSEIIQLRLAQYPQGAFFLFFSGRLLMIQGEVNDAIKEYENSIECQSQWKQLHHLCYWELMWCYCFKSDWLFAMKYAEILVKQSRWSQLTYLYMQASFLLMCEQSAERDSHLRYLMSEIPKKKQRIAGKSIPVEKFCAEKADRYFKQNERLMLPALELILVWNGFMIVGKKRNLLQPLYQIAVQQLELAIKENFSQDDISLAIVVKGVCLRQFGEADKAQKCFLEVLANEKKLVKDSYLAPESCLELAVIHMNSGDLAQARERLIQAKNEYKSYSMESRMQFRIHATSLQLAEREKAAL